MSDWDEPTFLTVEKLRAMSDDEAIAASIHEGDLDVSAALELAARMLEERNAARAAAKDNPLQRELLDLITLMPDTQTQEIVNYIVELRAIRARRDRK